MADTAIHFSSDSEMRVAVFSGNRADFGLLLPVLRAIQQHPALCLQLILGADHPISGSQAEIAELGFQPDLLIHHGLPSQTAPRMVLSTAQTLSQLSDFWEQCDRIPALLVILGDRFESFGAAQAAFYHQVPIAHIGGGDVTEGGCVDDTLRDLITDMAQLHWVSNPASQDRLLKRGVKPQAVTVTGSTVIDNLTALTQTPKAELCGAIGFSTDKPIVLFTQHPIAAEGETHTLETFQNSLAALDQLHHSHGAQILATWPNQDAFGSALDAAILAAQGRYPHMAWRKSLGHQGYLSWLAACDLVVGNSSSGLIETPFFRLPSVTVGPRQRGRLRADNVLACDYGQPSVYNACLRALTDPGFHQQISQGVNPFGDQPAAPVMLKSMLRFLVANPP